MTRYQHIEFVHHTIPQHLFHVSPTDIDETGGKLDEVILVQLITDNIGCLKYNSLSWYITHFLEN